MKYIINRSKIVQVLPSSKYSLQFRARTFELHEWGA